jgi:hypothetical protein
VRTESIRRFLKGLGWPSNAAGGDELTLDCPACHKSRHLHLNARKLLYHCKACDGTGDYMRLVDAILDETARPLSGPESKRLAGSRGLPPEAFGSCGFLYAGGGRLVAPVRDPRGTLTDVRWLDRRKRFCSAPGGKAGLLGAGVLGDASRQDEPCYLTEGEWDRAAIRYLLSVLGEPGIVLGVPGAGMFKADWARWLRDREVTVLYDNDEAGAKGEAKAASMLRHSAKTLRFHRWAADAPEGLDVNDLVSGAIK